MWCVDYEKAKLKPFGWTVVIPLSLTREPHMSSTRRSLGLALFFFFLWDFSISRSYSLFLGFSQKLLYSLIRKQIKIREPHAQSVVAKSRRKKTFKIFNGTISIGVHAASCTTAACLLVYWRVTMTTTMTRLAGSNLFGCLLRSTTTMTRLTGSPLLGCLLVVWCRGSWLHAENGRSKRQQASTSCLHGGDVTLHALAILWHFHVKARCVHP